MIRQPDPYSCLGTLVCTSKLFNVFNAFSVFQTVIDFIKQRFEFKESELVNNVHHTVTTVGMLINVVIKDMIHLYLEI